jgi:hypothetical protein
MTPGSALPPMTTDEIAQFAHDEKLWALYWMQQKTAAMARTTAQAIEKSILKGCAKCGKQLVIDGKPIEGARLLGRSMLDAIWFGNVEPPKAYCGECLRDGI